jgi:hypothetical protein
MPAPETKPLSTLEETARRRASLYRVIIEVEQATSRPAVAREQEWAQGVIEALERLDHELDDHVEITEGSGGLYDEIVAAAPRLAHRVEQLSDEHPELRGATQQLIERFRTTPLDVSWPVDDARDEVQRLLGKLVKHRQHGADLIWEAYTLDIGGVG